MAQQNSQNLTTPVAIQKHLKGIDYPASKQTLVETARRENAPQDVVEVLESLDDKEYGSPIDVTKAVGQHQ